MSYRVKSIRALVDCAKKIKENPAQKWDMQTWPPESWNYQDFQRWFLRCLNEKINRNDKRHSWRKMQVDYQIGLRRDARTINDYFGRRIHSQGCNLLNTKELKKKYPDINTYMADY